LRCALRKVEAQTRELSDDQVRDIIKQCNEDVTPPEITEKIIVTLSTCATSMVEKDMATCNTLRNVSAPIVEVMKPPIMPPLDWADDDLSTASFQFDMVFERMSQIQIDDPATLSSLRVTIADVIEMPVDRVHASFRLSLTQARRLLQNGDETVVDVWIYKDTRDWSLISPGSNNNSLVPEVLKDLFGGVDGFSSKIGIRMTSIQSLSFKSIGDGVIDDIVEPRKSMAIPPVSPEPESPMTTPTSVLPATPSPTPASATSTPISVDENSEGMPVALVVAVAVALILLLALTMWYQKTKHPPCPEDQTPLMPKPLVSPSVKPQESSPEFDDLQEATRYALFVNTKIRILPENYQGNKMNSLLK
jgi:hypothetical protein